VSAPRVLHLVPSLEIGGTEVQLVGFINRSSDPDRHRVACFSAIGELAGALPTEPIWLKRIGRRPSDAARDLRTVRALRRTIREGGFDVVHAHLGSSEVLAAMVTPRSTPIVASRRGRNVGFHANPVLRLIEGVGHRRADVLICNARFLAEEAEREDRWTPPTRVIPNGIDLDEFPLAAMPPDDEPRALVVANLHPAKRLDRFLRAFRLVLDELPGARATLAGGGPERASLERLVADLGLEGGVTFAGQVPDPRPLVAASHVVALTSEHEGFPNALLEAMAQGRPVVSTRVGGVPELVREGEDGFLTSGDPAEIAERIRALLVDAELRTRMGGSARERAGEFPWDLVVRETEEVYREVLARPRR
jgi:glycosyltransferase involved in cell wall biosynthesis